MSLKGPGNGQQAFFIHPYWVGVLFQNMLQGVIIRQKVSRNKYQLTSVRKQVFGKKYQVIDISII